MSPDSPASGSVRPARVVNEEIRALLVRRGGHLKPEDRPAYQRLVAEWVRAEVVKAA